MNIPIALLWYTLAVCIGPLAVIIFDITNPLVAFIVGFLGGFFPAKIGTGYLFGDYG